MYWPSIAFPRPSTYLARNSSAMFGNPLGPGGNLFIIIAVLLIAAVAAIVNIDVIRSMRDKPGRDDKQEH